MGDLGFSYRKTKQGTVYVFRGGRDVATLRSGPAERFLSRAEGASCETVQQLCARATGNYRRGNEAQAVAARKAKGRDDGWHGPTGGVMRIAETSMSDLRDVLFVERAAFGQDDEAELVRRLLDDPSALPLLSLLARDDDRPMGHILFTAVRLEGASRAVPATLLAPLAVVPEAQGRGIGGRLIVHGLELLSRSGVELVFVLGYPEYYQRHGFEPAGRHGLAAPFPISPEDAWMFRALRPGVIGSVHGTVVCADVMNEPEFWRE